MEDLRGKIAIVTGAGNGIGEAIASELAACGAQVAVIDINLSRAEKTVKQIESSGAKVAFPFKADVSVVEEVKAMVEEVIKRYGRIDILVNNVGISPKDKDGKRISILELDPCQWDHVLQVNLKGILLCTQAVAKEMKKHGGGSIVNITSLVAKNGITGPCGAHYCASKAGAMNFTIQTARELCQYNIRVNSVAPGTIQTSHREGTSSEYNQILLNSIPMGRFGLPSEVARAVAFLVSDSASYITGEILDVNGGLLMD
jgi:3-oxoacyl-[acyl-carrier protein] reductase